MHYDKLWYEVHEVGKWKLYFKVFIKAYEIEEEEFNGEIIRRMVEGGTITLSNIKTSGHGKHGRVSNQSREALKPVFHFSLTIPYQPRPQGHLRLSEGRRKMEKKPKRRWPWGRGWYLTLPYLTLPYLTLPYLTLLYRTITYRTLPYLTLPYRIVP